MERMFDFLTPYPMLPRCSDIHEVMLHSVNVTGVPVHFGLEQGQSFVEHGVLKPLAVFGYREVCDTVWQTRDGFCLTESAYDRLRASAEQARAVAHWIHQRNVDGYAPFVVCRYGAVAAVRAWLAREYAHLSAALVVPRARFVDRGDQKLFATALALMAYHRVPSGSAVGTKMLLDAQLGVEGVLCYSDTERLYYCAPCAELTAEQAAVLDLLLLQLAVAWHHDVARGAFYVELVKERLGDFVHNHWAF